MYAVIGTVVATSPLLSLLSINLLTADFKSTQSERFISEIASLSGGFGLKARRRNQRFMSASVRGEHCDHRRVPYLSRSRQQ